MRFPRFSAAICTLLASLLVLPNSRSAEPLIEKIDIFQAGNDGVALFRIPGIVVTGKGTVLAYCEARRTSGADWGEIEVHLRRSKDGGKTWAPAKQIAHSGMRIPGNPHKPIGGENEQTVNNPVAIVDRQTGAVHFLYCINYARCFYMRSDDDGATFSAPVEITAAFDKFRPECDWRCLATGPGHGIQLKSGRLVVPVWLAYGKVGAHGPSVTAVVFSDDHGKTWQRGDIALPNTPETVTPNETCAVELADGRVMLNARTGGSKASRRLMTISENGATGWTAPRFDPALFEPICMGSIVRYSAAPGGDKNRILFSNPHSLKLDAEGKEVPGARGERRNVSIKLSYDEGGTWPVNKTLEEGPSAYSDLAVLPDGTALCFYERGKLLTVARFNLEWLTDGKDSPPSRVTSRSLAPLPIMETVRIAGADIPTKSPPAGLVVREPLGLLAVEALDGQVVHRTTSRILETRATITPGGDYLLMFPEGDHYAKSKGEKMNTMLAYRSTDKGRTWQGPTVAFDIPYSQHGFIPLIPRGSKRIYAFGTQPIPGAWTWGDGQRENAPIGFRHSDDDGHTWSDVQLIEPTNDRTFRGMSVMRMTETDSGAWLLGSHLADWSVKPFTTRQYLLRSEDQGKTWKVLPGARPNGWFAEGFDRMDEGRPINLGGGRILFMSRTPQGHLFTARSEDDGRTWTTPAPSSLVHPDAPPMLFHLSDGRTLAAFHHNKVPRRGAGDLDDKSENMKVRSEIWLALSKDEGRTWSEPRFVFANAVQANLAVSAFNSQCSYLDMFVEDGVVHLFLPHRWHQVLHLTIKESALATLPTAEQLRSKVAAPAQ